MALERVESNICSWNVANYLKIESKKNKIWQWQIANWKSIIMITVRNFIRVVLPPIKEFECNILGILIQ